jgi:hypothetical protein
MQMPRKGTSASTALRASTSRPESRSARAQAPKAPTPGSTTPSARPITSGSAVSRASAPTFWSAFCAERRLPIP